MSYVFPDLRAVAREYALARKRGFNRDRSLTIGASDIGKCARRVAFDKTKTPIDDGYVDANGFATRGDVMEDAWTAPLLAYWVETYGNGELLYAGQANQIELQAKSAPISCTPDGLAVNVERGILAPYNVPDIGPSKCIVAEMKSISPRYSKSRLPKRPHPMQTLLQIGLIRAALPQYRPEWGVVVYVDADNYWDVDVYPVKWSESGFKSLVKRAVKIKACTDPKTMPPEGKMWGGHECSECPFARRCLGYRPYSEDDPKALAPKKVEKIEKLMARAVKLKAAAEAAKEAHLEAQADVYLAMTAEKRSFVKGKTFYAHAKHTEPQMRNDVKKLLALLKEKKATKEELEACKTLTKPGSSFEVDYVK